MSKLEDFEDIEYEDTPIYTPKELEEYIQREKEAQKVEYEKEINTLRMLGSVQADENKKLIEENEFYKRIIKSILKI